MATAQDSGFLVLLQFHIVSGIVIFFALFSQTETLSIRSGGAGFAV